MINQQQKYALLGIICLTACLVMGISSSIFTASLLYGMGDGAFGLIMAAIGICMDLGKYVFPILAAYNFAKGKWLAPIIFSALMLICLIISFFASSTYDLNQSNRIANEAMKNSTENQRLNELFGNSITTKEEAEKKLKEIDSEEYLKKIINDDEVVKENRKIAERQRKMDYITDPEKGAIKFENIVTERIKEITNLHNESINSLKSIVSANSNTAVKVNEDMKNIDIKTEKGIYSLAQWIDKNNPDKVVGWIFVVKNILIEIVSIAFGIGAGMFLGIVSLKTKENKDNKKENEIKKEKVNINSNKEILVSNSESQLKEEEKEEKKK